MASSLREWSRHAAPSVDPDVFAYGRSSTHSLVSVYAMRMAAVFALAVSTAGIRTAALPRWAGFLGYLVGLTLMLAADEQKWTQLVFPAWVLVVSVVLLIVPSRTDDQADA